MPQKLRYIPPSSISACGMVEVSCRTHQERVRHMIREIEEETAERHRREGTRPLGRRAALRVAPHAWALDPKRRPRPFVHAATRRVREAVKEAYRRFAEAFRAAAQALQAGVDGVEFPPGSFPPRLPYVMAEPAPG